MLYILIIISLLSSCSFEYEKFYYPQNCNQLNLLPMPYKINCTLDSNKIYKIKDPCKIKYNVKQESLKKQFDHIIELINHQQQKTFKCLSSYIQIVGEDLISIMDSEVQYNVMITIQDSALRSAFSTKQEAYDLQITQKSAELKSEHYVGFVRGLETFLQSITCDKKSKNCFMLALPIQISDVPQYEYRGVLVDSSRHFLPLDILKQTIDSLMYNKMNIFHWHIVDQDSFPLELQSHPELAQYSSFSVHETYSTQEIKEFIKYAMIRGVRIIPEIDTPGHAASWGKAPKNSRVACSLAGENSQSLKYKGTLDITLDQTYKIVEQVFKQVFQLFPDPYVHLGGDQVQLKCLSNLTEFLRLQNITQQQLQIHYRRKQKKILKKLNQSKTFIYWITDKILEVEEDDIVHWWGSTSLVPHIKDRKIIISRYVKQLYIDMGAGSTIGREYYSYGTWYDMHSLNFNSEVQESKNRKNVLGLVVTLWSQISNMYTHHTKIWIRSSSMAERSWTKQDFLSKPDFFRRITAHQRIMNRRGIPTAPATNQQCEYSPQFC